eukprot:391882-Prymnesium_polylepis.1
MGPLRRVLRRRMLKERLEVLCARAPQAKGVARAGAGRGRRLSGDRVRVRGGRRVGARMRASKKVTQSYSTR